MTDESATGIAAAQAHLTAAAQALGVRLPSASAGDDRALAERIHKARPGVSAQMAFAVIGCLRALGWVAQSEIVTAEHVFSDPVAEVAAERERAEAAEAKLAEIRGRCTEAAAIASVITGAGGRSPKVEPLIEAILAITGSEETQP